MFGCPGTPYKWTADSRTQNSRTVNSRWQKVHEKSCPICQKSYKNHLKLTPGGSWGRSCGHCSPQVPPGQQKRRKNAKIGASTGYPEGPENRYFRVKTQTKPDGKGSMNHCPFSWYLPWAFRLDFDSFLTALGIIKIVKSVQLYAN